MNTNPILNFFTKEEIEELSKTDLEAEEGIAQTLFDKILDKIRTAENGRQLLNDFLKFDPLAYSEEVIQNSPEVPSDEKGVLAMMIGLQMTMMHGALKAELLKALSDTTFSNELGGYIQILMLTGFQRALTIPFMGSGGKQEQFFIYAHRAKGIILRFDTYGGDHVNSGKIFYCIRPKKGIDICEFGRRTSSGYYDVENKSDWTPSEGFREDTYWRGNHDCREALKHNISQLEEVGTFMPKWPTFAGHDSKYYFNDMNPLHYMEWRGMDGTPHHLDREKVIQQISAERYAMLPKWVKEIMGEPA